MDIPHIKSAAAKIQKAYAAAEAAKLAQKEIGLLFDDETARRRELGRALSQQADKAKKLLAAARIDLGLAEDDLHEKWAEGERAMRSEGEFRPPRFEPKFKIGDRVRFDRPPTANRPAYFGTGQVSGYHNRPDSLVTSTGEMRTVDSAPVVAVDGGLPTVMHESILVRIEDQKATKPRARGTLRLVENDMSAIEDEIEALTPGARATVQGVMRELGSQDITLDMPELSSSERRIKQIRSTIDAIAEKRDLGVKFDTRGFEFISPKFRTLRVNLFGGDGVSVTQVAPRGDKSGGRSWSSEQVGDAKATVRYIRARVEDSLDWLMKREGTRAAPSTPKGVEVSSSGQWEWNKSTPPPVTENLPVTIVVGNSSRAGKITDVNKKRTRITVRDDRDGEEARYSWRKGSQGYWKVGEKPAWWNGLRLGVAKDYYSLD